MRRMDNCFIFGLFLFDTVKQDGVVSLILILIVAAMCSHVTEALSQAREEHKILFYLCLWLCLCCGTCACVIVKATL